MISDQHPTWIKFPASHEDVNDAKQRWSDTWNSIGAIDFTPTYASKSHTYNLGMSCINRKNFPLFNMPATWDE